MIIDDYYLPFPSPCIPRMWDSVGIAMGCRGFNPKLPFISLRNLTGLLPKPKAKNGRKSESGWLKRRPWIIRSAPGPCLGLRAWRHEFPEQIKSMHHRCTRSHAFGQCVANRVGHPRSRTPKAPRGQDQREFG